MTHPETLESAEDETGAAHEPAHAAPHGKRLLALTIGALGVVYGDIGTSPLYALRESFRPSYAIPVSPANVLGVLSLIVWSLLIIISVKYLIFVMRADLRGEGGILALTALIIPVRQRVERYTGRWLIILLGLFGTALLYGDGMITPAISVLSAVEGLGVATPFFEPYILPLTTLILVALFLLQRRGTASVGRIFGPVTLLWFIVLALLGLRWIAVEPGVIAAINPLHGLSYFLRNGQRGFLVLGSVFLVVTGGEALYADMGHFGRRPIKSAWFTLVLPALLLNYLGQGALLLAHPEAVEELFYRMAPSWALYPLVLLATLATVIASQALITGAFSLTMQAVNLGYLPRVEIHHTSAAERGQIYIPAVNWTLMAACIGLVFAFRTSGNLAAAYGVAVTTTMAITTLLLFRVEIERWRWPLSGAVAFTLIFLTIDLAFWGANLLKIPAGGWVPLLIGALVFTIMTTWKRGRGLLVDRLRAGSLPFADFAARLRVDQYARVPGTAVFMSSDPQGTPPALLHNLHHNHVLHERVLLLSVQIGELPRVPARERIEVHDLGHGFYQVLLHYGFLDHPNVPRDLAGARRHGVRVVPDETSYFLGRERILATGQPGMALWRERLFVLLSRNARSAPDFYQLPHDRIVELGSQIRI